MSPTPVLPDAPLTPASARSTVRVQTMKANTERRQINESKAMKNEEEKLSYEREKKATADKTRKKTKEDQEMSETTPKSTKQTQKLPIGDKRAKRNLDAGEDEAEKRQAAGSPAWVDSRKRPAISILRRNKGKPSLATTTNTDRGGRNFRHEKAA